MRASFFSANRERSVQATGGLIVLSAFTQMQLTNDAASRFEQEANFWYLTGIESPDWWVIIDGKSNQSWLVEPEIDQIHRIFNGGLSPEEAKYTSGIDTVLSRSEADALLLDLAKKRDIVYTLGISPDASHYDFVLNPAQKQMQKYLKRVFKDVRDCRLELAKLRAIKQPVEIEAIKKAINLTIEAFEDIKKKLPNFKYEYEIEAAFSYYFRTHGAQGHAYDAIVASGNNACTLHYSDNNDPLAQNALLLLDIGARVDGYAADISRTYSVGKPTARQIAVHAALESTQQQIIKLLKPGLLVQEYHEKVESIMRSALKGLGLKWATPDGSRGYFPHAVSHGLGIDVHDSLGRPTELLEGMVLTVEPGIYIPEESIGVRIEDDILITATGHQNLSEALSTSL